MRLVISALFSVTALAVLTLLALPGGNSDAAWPGSNGRIVFFDPLDAGIWIMDADGSNRDQLTFNDDSYPTWAPDGSKIVFQRGFPVLRSPTQPQGTDPDCGSDIWTMDPDGNNAQPITSGSTPSWSPDGSRIIYSCNGSLMETDATPGGGNIETITMVGGVFDEFPVYRPGSTETIAFLRTTFLVGRATSGFISQDHPNVFTMDTDGSNTNPVTNTDDYAEGPPDWAPDGSGLVFRGQGGHIYRWNFGGGAPTVLLDSGGDSLLFPSYSPDGAKVAYTFGVVVNQTGEGGVAPQGIPANDNQIYTMNSNGSSPQPVPGAPSEPKEIHADWEPVSATPTPSPSPSPTASASAEPTATPTPSAEPTATAGPSATAEPTGSAAPTLIMDGLVWADYQCDEEANPIDSLFTLRFDAGLAVNAGACPPMGIYIEVLSINVAGLDEGDGDAQTWGNADCDAQISPIDSLKILRYDAGLSVNQEDGCPPIGSDVTVQYAP